MEVTLEGLVANSTSYLKKSFNPYSNGSYFGRDKPLTERSMNVEVSILILMEVTLEDYGVNGYFLFPNRFNPYSNGSYFGSQYYKPSFGVAWWFQSLF